MRLNSGQASYVNLCYTAYYLNENYHGSVGNKDRNPICLIFHFQTILDKSVEIFSDSRANLRFSRSFHLDSSKQKTVTPRCPLSQYWVQEKSSSHRCLSVWPNIVLGSQGKKK